MEQYLEVGKITSTHGVKGEVKVVPLTDDPQRFEELKWVFLDKGNSMEKYNIDSVKYQKNNVILKFREVKDMDTAQSLKGVMLKVDRQNAVKLPKDSFFICDLIGLQVYDETGVLLGKLNNILKTGSNDVYIINDDKGKETLIPALKSVVKKISIEEGKIIVIPQEGLVDYEI